MTQLHSVIAEHGEGRVRADLAHLYGVNLDDVLDGRVGSRHALMLLGQSPAYAASMIRDEIVGAEAARWDVTTSAVVHLSDLFAEFLGGLAKQPADAYKFPRPGAKTASEEEPVLFAPTIAEFDVGGFMSKFA